MNNNLLTVRRVFVWWIYQYMLSYEGYQSFILESNLLFLIIYTFEYQ